MRFNTNEKSICKARNNLLPDGQKGPNDSINAGTDCFWDNLLYCTDKLILPGRNETWFYKVFIA